MRRALEGEAAMHLAADDVLAAVAALREVAVRTPVLTSQALDARTGAEVSIKCENLQRTGSFKFRGAYTAIAQLSPPELERGVIAFSSGNHALAVADAARRQGTKAVVVMPSDAPPTKLAAVATLGARVVTFDRYRDDRHALTARLAADHGLVTIPPYDHPDVIAGAGTTTLELLEQAGDLDMIVMPLGAGGQLAGACCAIAGHTRAMRLVGVETAAGDKFRRSLRVGRRVRIPVPRTIADGVTGEIPGELTFPLVKRYAAEVVAVSDDEIRAAMVWLFEEAHLVVEPSGALALAALLAGRVDGRGLRVGVIVSGGNIDLQRFHTLARRG
jgi:threo-3-hydroxy-L-aspartate ammonia-lyase